MVRQQKHFYEEKTLQESMKLSDMNNEGNRTLLQIGRAIRATTGFADKGVHRKEKATKLWKLSIVTRIYSLGFEFELKLVVLLLN